MIKASELRIGNLLEYNSKYLTVNSIVETSIRFEGNIYAFCKDVKPIPLSEEILIKAGFVKMLETEYTINTYQLGFIKLWDKKGDFSQLFIQLHEYIEIKHLHTLQNFYYLLSNCKELEIEL